LRGALAAPAAAAGPGCRLVPDLETMASRGGPTRRQRVAGGSDPALGAYPATGAAGLTRVIGPALVGLYLHGSAAMGGWSAERSDVDLLGVVARTLDGRAKRGISARLPQPSLVC